LAQYTSLNCSFQHSRRHLRKGGLRITGVAKKGRRRKKKTRRGGKREITYSSFRLSLLLWANQGKRKKRSRREVFETNSKTKKKHKASSLYVIKAGFSGSGKGQGVRTLRGGQVGGCTRSAEEKGKRERILDQEGEETDAAAGSICRYRTARGRHDM